MEEKDFELLAILNETQNITRASELLFMTQSALSKRIKAIEKELGIELFSRSRSGIRFTPAGEEVLAHSTEAAKVLEDMRRKLSALHSEICGSIRMGISINFSLFLLPPLLVEFHRKYPKVNLHIQTGQSRNLHKQLLDGSMDLAILRGEFAWDGMQYLLSQEHLCVVFDPKYKDVPLSKYMYIGHKTDSTQAALIARWLYENNLNPRANRFWVDSLSVCLKMVEAGLGWAILPEIALQDFQGVKIPCSFLNGEPLLRRTYLHYQRDSASLPQINAFIQLLKERMNNL